VAREENGFAVRRAASFPPTINLPTIPRSPRALGFESTTRLRDRSERTDPQPLAGLGGPGTRSPDHGNASHAFTAVGRYQWGAAAGGAGRLGALSRQLDAQPAQRARGLVFGFAPTRT